MEVFVGNLHDSVAYRDLALLFKDFKQPRVNLIEKPLPDGTLVRYAVVTFESDRLAKKAIGKLDGHPLRGQPIAVREFFHRSYVNERRAIDWRTKAWSGTERRQNDRRKGQRQAAPEAPFDAPAAPAPAPAKEPEFQMRIEGYRDLARKH